jgi:pimeloyl-ACP methyl ester carboxylesterase
MQRFAAFDFGAMNLQPIDWAGLLGLLGLGLGVAIITLVLVLRSKLVHPPRRTLAWAVSRSWPATPGEIDVQRFGTGPVNWRHRQVQARNGQMRLSVWEIDGRDATGPTVVMTHGWADSKLSALARLEPVLDSCARVIAWDLPGHGESSGHSEMGRLEHELLERVLDDVIGERDVTRLVLFGWSLGAGVSIRYAATGRRAKDVEQVILEAPYTLPQIPAMKVAEAAGMPRALVWPALVLAGGLAWLKPEGTFDRRGYAKQLACSVTVLHGEMDPVCPIDGGEAIAKASTRGLMHRIAGARHNDLWINPIYREACVTIVREAMANGGLAKKG